MLHIARENNFKTGSKIKQKENKDGKKKWWCEMNTQNVCPRSYKKTQEGLNIIAVHKQKSEMS